MSQETLRLPKANWSNDELDELHVNLQYLDDCKLDCDGMTYAIAIALEDANIEHTRMVGHVHWVPGEDVIDPHCWIELPVGAVIDFRLRMWVGDDDEVPHGIFYPDSDSIQYVGQAQTCQLPGRDVMEVMTDGRLSSIKLHRHGSNDYERDNAVHCRHLHGLSAVRPDSNCEAG